MHRLFVLMKENELIRSAFVLAAGIIVYNLLKIIIRCFVKTGKTSFERKRRNTIIRLLENIFKYIIFIAVLLIILDIYGVDTKSLVAGIGVAGVVIGLALQDLLKDLISGLSIMLENYFVIGDIIEYEGFTGEVVEFGLKSTKIRNIGGETLCVANRNIAKVKNLSQKSANVMIKVPTAYEEKEEKVVKVLNSAIERIIAETDADNLSEYVGIDELDTSSINYLVKIHCPQDKRFDVRRKALAIIKSEYDKNNVKIPYSQIEVHNAK